MRLLTILILLYAFLIVSGLQIISDMKSTQKLTTTDVVAVRKFHKDCDGHVWTRETYVELEYVESELECRRKKWVE